MEPYGDDTLSELAHCADDDATLDDFDALCRHLEAVHLSQHGPLFGGVPSVFLRGLRPVDDQSVALRLAVLAGRLSDRTIPVQVSGVSLDKLCAPELLTGGYRTTYYRATGRLVALARRHP
ncbi:AFG1/ZapE family ATPase [Phytoactinopolyspora halophila]|uniref:AFG1/ZapE family ATPase n=1 Tax=Phytoactinopolyspora halophila TaxID=1981511 RepID=UPI001B8C517B|nr:AFG1/ZapE family ATPase [Phytoactinopolyspora halophila]